ncbi:MAG: hypothetical protein NTX61_10055 [Bacteroidetes bacterium]|nr:hypothetical protein [Bacteroidota bacterium]
MFKRNSYIVGIVFGIILPGIIFGFLFGINAITGVFSHPPVLLPLNKMLFVSTALNIIPMRYYFIHGGVEDTGKGILIITVIMIILITLVIR